MPPAMKELRARQCAARGKQRVLETYPSVVDMSADAQGAVVS
jgi:hypothetical protein